MKSIDYMTKEELLATADEFHKVIDRGADLEFSRELSFYEDLEEEERGEIDKLVSDIASETITRLVQWFIQGSDK